MAYLFLQWANPVNRKCKYGFFQITSRRRFVLSLNDGTSLIINQFWNSRTFFLIACRQKQREFLIWLMMKPFPSFRLKTNYLYNLRNSIRLKKSKFQILHRNLHKYQQLENQILHLQLKNRLTLKDCLAKGQKLIPELKNQDEIWLPHPQTDLAIPH